MLLAQRPCACRGSSLRRKMAAAQYTARPQTLPVSICYGCHVSPSLICWLQLAVSDQGLQQELSELDDSGYSLLHYACLYGLVPLVALLLERGAAVNAPTGMHLRADYEQADYEQADYEQADLPIVPALCQVTMG